MTIDDEAATEDLTVHPESAAPPFGGDGWRWHAPHRGEHFRRCSWCGSIHPADLAAEPTWYAEWADRKYGWPHKFYVDVPNRDPDALFVVITQDREPNEHERRNWTWARTDALPDALRAIAERDGALVQRFSPHTGEPIVHNRWLGFGTRAHHFGKFYTIHLRDAALDLAIKAEIERVSGLAFDFDGARVGWRPADRG